LCERMDLTIKELECCMSPHVAGKHWHSLSFDKSQSVTVVSN
jgi:hypothetical protein